MGDRTTVTLIVLHEDESSVTSILRPDDRDEDFTKSLTYLTYYEVNYGELFFLPELKDMCIPFIANWDKGSEYDEGTEFFMFNEEGEAETLSYYEHDRTPSLENLIKLCDRPDELVTYILTYRDQFKRPSWTIQRDQSLIARAKKLIGA